MLGGTPKKRAMRPLSIIAITAALAAALTGAAVAGDIQGDVSITTPIRTRPVGPRRAQHETEHAKVAEVQNVVVHLEKVDPAAFKVPTAHAVMMQKDKEFIPDVLPIVAGQTVDFPNRDPIYHDVYSESPGYQFEVTGYKGGDSRSRLFSQPGVVELFCAIHSGMNANILVLQNPYFAMPDAHHHYVIKNVPSGHYVLKAWHPRLDAKTVNNVFVPPSGPVLIDFEM